MQTHNLGYPRIGNHRELKKVSEQYWSGNTSAVLLEAVGKTIRLQNWKTQQEAGIGLIPCNDFSFYDHVLDTAFMVGAIPDRYHALIEQKHLNHLDLYFAMARGYQKDGYDITAMEMTKWFDTNYHYIVPEFTATQKFVLFSEKAVHHYIEARDAGIAAKPVLLGPVSFLLLGKEKENNFHRLELIKNLLPVYIELLKKLDAVNAHYIQFDEPCLCLDLTDDERDVFVTTYNELKKQFPHLHFIIASYFECYGNNLETALSLPVQTLHLDMVRCPSQLDDILNKKAGHQKINLSLGIVDGRNIWKNDFTSSLTLIKKAVDAIGVDRVWIAPSCSLLHVPCDLDAETNEKNLPTTVKAWMAFAKQKLSEVAVLASLSSETPDATALCSLEKNIQSHEARKTSTLVHRPKVKERTQSVTDAHAQRLHSFSERKKQQKQSLQLPPYPTTTIGSFPQTPELRSWRAQWKKGKISNETYDELIKKEIATSIQWQEDIGIDVLVHGEFERNDMVEYFGEQLDGFVFTQNGWVQSYGSRCVKPPIIVGDVSRKTAMTVYYTQYAQSLTATPVKGMLTGPVTILQWSFVRDDQPRSQTCMQIALAIRDEVADLENAGIQIIQIDEPAIREGLPLRKEGWKPYLNWAVKAFKVSSCGVKDSTQIHTHMCYSEFNDIIESIAAMDADVITIETSRSQMELLDVFASFQYPNDIGPGVYDIHSPRVPSKEEMLLLIGKANDVIPADQIWINPDCGLKTRHWEETKLALKAMVDAAADMRKNIRQTSTL